MTFNWGAQNKLHLVFYINDHPFNDGEAECLDPVFCEAFQYLSNKIYTLRSILDIMYFLKGKIICSQ